MSNQIGQFLQVVCRLVPCRPFCTNRPTPLRSLCTVVANMEKRKTELLQSPEIGMGESEQKSQKLDNASECEEAKVRKKKVALLLMYSGVGYTGMQRNPGIKTIEEDLAAALVGGGVIPQAHADEFYQMKFQRAARTDKGVSAAGQVCSLKMLMYEDAAERINKYLPAQIRVLGFKRTTGGFNAKYSCCSRTYSYMLPTFAFAPVEQITQDKFRITDEIIAEANELLKLYKGTHNFHNFTSGRKSTDPSSYRHILDTTCGKPFMRSGLEWCVITIHGQSFMLHQIRKMVGLLIAIMRGLADQSVIQKAWGHDRVDIPKAPGLGLVLEKVHYDAYNKRYGGDGLHEAIDWSQYKKTIDKFKDEFICSTIVNTEKSEHTMLTWLSTLPLHEYDVREPDDNIARSQTRSSFGKALVAVEMKGSEEQNICLSASALTGPTVERNNETVVTEQDNQTESSAQVTGTNLGVNKDSELNILENNDRTENLSEKTRANARIGENATLSS